MKHPWKKVVFADLLPDCPDGCGEKWCPKCQTHFFECDCIGPTMDGVEYKEVKGVIYGRKTGKE
jgi:hypothetical protein